MKTTTNNVTKRRAGFGAAIFFSLLIMIVASCGGKKTAEAPNGAAATVLRYAVWSSPSGLFHPLLYFTDYDRNVIFVVYDRLVVVDQEQNFKPKLAGSYEFSEDERTITFHLRPGVKWHDGKPFTAGDVAFTYQATASGDYPNDTPDFATHLEGYEEYHNGSADSVRGIRVIDDNTISFTFSSVYAGTLAYFADRPVLAKHIWENAPISTWNEATSLLQNPVGTGPFKFSEYVPDQYVSLVRNPDYFDGAPRIDQFIYKVSNRDTAQAELISGELDIAELSSFNPSDLKLYEDNKITIVEHVGSGAQYATLDYNDPRLADVRVRQALLYAVDRKAIIDRLLYGHGIVLNTLLHPESYVYPDDLEPYAYNPEKAKALLAEAGWKDSDGDGIVEKGGQKFILTLNYPTGNRTRELSAPVLQQYWRDIGIETELILADFNSTLAILQNSATEYDAMLMGATFRVDSYDTNHWWERFEDSHEKDIVTRMNGTLDPASRGPLIQEWAKFHNEKVIRLWLYIPNIGYAVSPAVLNYGAYPYEPFNNIQNWEIRR
jgi:peptide/nickel transport system substrate-binding protein